MDPTIRLGDVTLGGFMESLLTLLDEQGLEITTKVNTVPQKEKTHLTEVDEYLPNILSALKAFLDKKDVAENLLKNRPVSSVAVNEYYECLKQSITRGHPDWRVSKHGRMLRIESDDDIQEIDTQKINNMLRKIFGGEIFTNTKKGCWINPIEFVKTAKAQGIAAQSGILTPYFATASKFTISKDDAGIVEIHFTTDLDDDDVLRLGKVICDNIVEAMKDGTEYRGVINDRWSVAAYFGDGDTSIRFTQNNQLMSWGVGSNRGKEFMDKLLEVIGTTTPTPSEQSSIHDAGGV